jgi:hypothetical protein
VELATSDKRTERLKPKSPASVVTNEFDSFLSVEATRRMSAGASGKCVLLSLRYADWLKIQKGPHPELLVTMRLKEEEEKHIRLLVKSIEAQAESAATLLDKHRDVLPTSPETKPDTLYPFSLEQGWLQPTLRSPAWRTAMAQWLVDKLANFRLGHTSDGHPIRMLLTPEDRHRLTRMLEKV